MVPLKTNGLRSRETTNTDDFNQKCLSNANITTLPIIWPIQHATYSLTQNRSSQRINEFPDWLRIRCRSQGSAHGRFNACVVAERENAARNEKQLSSGARVCSRRSTLRGTGLGIAISFWHCILFQRFFGTYVASGCTSIGYLHIRNARYQGLIRIVFHRKMLPWFLSLYEFSDSPNGSRHFRKRTSRCRVTNNLRLRRIASASIRLPKSRHSSIRCGSSYCTKAIG